jgi:hypothetical protein
MYPGLTPLIYSRHQELRYSYLEILKLAPGVVKVVVRAPQKALLYQLPGLAAIWPEAITAHGLHDAWVRDCMKVRNRRHLDSLRQPAVTTIPSQFMPGSVGKNMQPNATAGPSTRGTPADEVWAALLANVAHADEFGPYRGDALPREDQ